MNHSLDLVRDQTEPRTLVDYFSRHSVKTFLWPDAWRNAKSQCDLQWNRVTFGSDTIEDVPEMQGIYAFSICIKNSIMPPHGVIVYFGETSRTLRERYREYLRDSKRGAKRIIFQLLFEQWPSDLDFLFAALPDTDCDLKLIEMSLNDAVIPFCATRGFSAEIQKIVRILRT